eukprot:m.307122 g.307122  ORF g.307122 m.307122 type:complete len:332 (+) comp15932_c0_seq1:113-1108(+)
MSLAKSGFAEMRRQRRKATDPLRYKPGKTAPKTHEVMDEREMLEAVVAKETEESLQRGEAGAEAQEEERAVTIRPLRPPIMSKPNLGHIETMLQDSALMERLPDKGEKLRALHERVQREQKEQKLAEEERRQTVFERFAKLASAASTTGTGGLQIKERMTYRDRPRSPVLDSDEESDSVSEPDPDDHDEGGRGMMPKVDSCVDTVPVHETKPGTSEIGESKEIRKEEERMARTLKAPAASVDFSLDTIPSSEEMEANFVARIMNMKISDSRKELLITTATRVLPPRAANQTQMLSLGEELRLNERRRRLELARKDRMLRGATKSALLQHAS